HAGRSGHTFRLLQARSSREWVWGATAAGVAVVIALVLLTRAFGPTTFAHRSRDMELMPVVADVETGDRTERRGVGMEPDGRAGPGRCRRDRLAARRPPGDEVARLVIRKSGLLPR